MAMNLVVGVDGSEESERALAVAAGLASREKGRLDVCFVAHQPISFGGNMPPVDYVEISGTVELEVKEVLANANVEGSYFYREGDIADELKRLADERSADIIVIGRSRHPHLHLGSVPKRLLDTVGHSVLVVP
jgi:nucleotide-binding universal stress UspA family protein